MRPLDKKEEAVRDILDGARWEVDTDALWQDISPRLGHEPSRRRPILWWMWGGAALVLLSLLGFWWSARDIGAVQPDLAPAPMADARPQHTPSAASTQDDVAPVQGQSLDGSADDITESAHAAVAQPTQENTIPASSHDTSTPSTSVRSTTASPSVLRSTTSATLLGTTASNAEPKQDYTTATANTTQHEGQETAIQLAAEQEAASVTSTSGAEVSSSTSRAMTLSLASLAARPWLAIATDRERELEAGPWAPVRVAQPSSSYYILASLGALLPEWRFGGDAEDWSDNEKALPGLHARLGVGKQINRRWRLGGGLAYGQAVARYTGTLTSIQTEQVPGVESYQVNSFGETVPRLGLIDSTTVTVREVNWHRQHRQVFGFAEVGYKAMQWGPLSVELDAGLGYNLWSRSSGYIYDSTEGVRQVAEGEPRPYQSTGMMWEAGLGLTYDLSAVSIGLRSFYRIIPNTYTQNSNSISLKSSQLGLELGMVIRPDWE